MEYGSKYSILKEEKFLSGHPLFSVLMMEPCLKKPILTKGKNPFDPGFECISAIH
jgi:hypothetical protein